MSDLRIKHTHGFCRCFQEYAGVLLAELWREQFSSEVEEPIRDLGGFGVRAGVNLRA